VLGGTDDRCRNPDTEQLLERAKAGEKAAVNELMTRHRKRLRHMVAVRMDSRLARRVDPSDVVQETLAEAAVKLPDYLLNRPIPFYPLASSIGLESADRPLPVSRQGRPAVAGPRSERGIGALGCVGH